MFTRNQNLPSPNRDVSFTCRDFHWTLHVVDFQRKSTGKTKCQFGYMKNEKKIDLEKNYPEKCSVIHLEIFVH